MSSSDSVLQVLLAEASFHDITLACDDYGLLGAHKVILCAKSRLFRRILQDPTKQKPFLTFPGISLAHLTSAVQFLYLGKVEVDNVEAGDFLELLKYLEVEGFNLDGDIAEEIEVVRPQTKKFAHEEKKLIWTNDDVDKEEAQNRSMDTIEDRFEFYDEGKFEGKKGVPVKSISQDCGPFDYGAINKSNTPNKEKIFCDLCSYETKQARGLVTHKVAKHNIGSRHECDNCDKSFSKKQSLRDHMKYVHEGIEPPAKPDPKTCYPCKDCDFMGQTIYFLQQHIKNLHSRVSCDICGFRGLSQYAIRRHKESVHEDVVHNCPHCERIFKQIQSLKIHMQATHGPQDNLCSKCDYKTGLRSRLRNHEREAHSGGYKCDVCGHISRQKHGLRNHQNSIHKRIKYRCESEGCETEYSLKQNLKNHIITKHEGVSYPCNVDGCDYKGSKKVFVTKHNRIVHKGVRYWCNECGYKARRAQHLKVHFKKHFTEQEIKNIQIIRFQVVPQ